MPLTLPAGLYNNNHNQNPTHDDDHDDTSPPTPFPTAAFGRASQLAQIKLGARNPASAKDAKVKKENGESLRTITDVGLRPAPEKTPDADDVDVDDEELEEEEENDN